MGITEEDRAGLDKSLKDLNLSNAEVDKFAKAFKDPEFLKLFEEYAKEVSDPKVKAETDMYLRQLEMEGRLEEVYGKGAQLIMPTPEFVVKTHDTGNGTKAFINICTSDKLEKASLKPATGANGQKGMHFDMPLCLGPKKAGADKAGTACSVWDFVVHPETLKMAAAKPAIHTAMIENAIEKIEACNEGVKLHRKTKTPKITYKATEGCPTPHALTLRGNEAESVGGRVKPVSSASAPGAKAGAAQGDGGGAAALQQGEAAAAAAAAAATAAATPSKFAFPSAKAPKAAKAPLEATQAGYMHPGGEVTPQWEVVHRGLVDLTEAWGDAGRGMALNTSHPKELAIRITLPGVASAAGVQLDVSCNDVSLLVPQKYLLKVPLPLTVDSDKGRAKFDKARQQLEVLVPVVPPPLPRPAAADPPRQQGSGCEAAADGGGGSLVQELPDVAAEPGCDADAVAGAAVEPEPPVSPAAPSGETQPSENQRRWAELHASQAQAAASQAVDAGQSSQAGDVPGSPAVQLTGAHSPAQPHTSGGDVPPPRSPPPPAVVKLQPRLNQQLATELD